MNRAVNPERVVQAFIEEGTTALSSHVHAAIGESFCLLRKRRFDIFRFKRTIRFDDRADRTHRTSDQSVGPF